MRSVEGGVDVSEVAAVYSGGGGSGGIAVVDGAGGGEGTVMNDMTLDTLAAEINILHRSAEHHVEQAIVYAARCGLRYF
jgi:hypothetical protein